MAELCSAYHDFVADAVQDLDKLDPADMFVRNYSWNPGEVLAFVIVNYDRRMGITQVCNADFLPLPFQWEYYRYTRNLQLLLPGQSGP